MIDGIEDVDAYDWASIERLFERPELRNVRIVFRVDGELHYNDLEVERTIRTRIPQCNSRTVLHFP